MFDQSSVNEITLKLQDPLYVSNILKWKRLKHMRCRYFQVDVSFNFDLRSDRQQIHRLEHYM